MLILEMAIPRSRNKRHIPKIKKKIIKNKTT